jgi:ArsR family transcriptional regulator, cadmium/lead-responsive transcriptional repressor
MMISKPSEAFGLQAKLFRGLSDHSRLAILEMLRHGPAPVGHIAEKTGLAQSNTSNHLRCLSECGLVTSEQEGRFVYYRLSDHRIDTLLLLADDLLASKARNLYACTNYQKPQAIRQTQIGKRPATTAKRKVRARASGENQKKQRNASSK